MSNFGGSNLKNDSPDDTGQRVVIVTGGSRGIGAAVARAAARQGYAVAVNFASDAVAAQSVVQAIVSSGGVAKAYRADISKEEDVVNLFRDVEQELGSLSVLINNGGVTAGFSRVDEVSAAALSHVFAVNVIGAFLCCREAVRRMSRKHGGRGGSIVNISSRAAQLGGSGEWVHYAATKGALDTLTVGLAREVASEGVRVNAIAAGLIDTELHAAAGSPDRASQLAASIPLGRPGSPDEVAEAVLWLISPQAAYVTGAIVPVSGGR